MLMLNESNQIKGEHLYIDLLKTKCIIKKANFLMEFLFCFRKKKKKKKKIADQNERIEC